ncbi:MAG TPA: hypothetical protein ENK83_08475 [Aliiroseovarius sp.]|nr:hypothetical protein [Aliiroseovarius sp.]
MAQSASCDRPDLASAMTRIEAYYESEPARTLFVTQLLLREGAGADDLATDGRWGPRTEAEICGALRTYTAINGATLIDGPPDVAEFADWIAAMAYFNVNGGEAPD